MIKECGLCFGGKCEVRDIRANLENAGKSDREIRDSILQNPRSRDCADIAILGVSKLESESNGGLLPSVADYFNEQAGLPEPKRSVLKGQHQERKYRAKFRKLGLNLPKTEE